MKSLSDKFSSLKIKINPNMDYNYQVHQLGEKYKKLKATKALHTKIFSSIFSHTLVFLLAVFLAWLTYYASSNIALIIIPGLVVIIPWVILAIKYPSKKLGIIRYDLKYANIFEGEYIKITKKLLVSPFTVPLYEKIKTHNESIELLRQASLAYELYRPSSNPEFEKSLCQAYEKASKNYEELTRLQQVYIDTMYIEKDIYEKTQNMLVDTLRQQSIEEAFTESLELIQIIMDVSIENIKTLKE